MYVTIKILLKINVTLKNQYIFKGNKNYQVSTELQKSVFQEQRYFFIFSLILNSASLVETRPIIIDFDFAGLDERKADESYLNRGPWLDNYNLLSSELKTTKIAYMYLKLNKFNL